MIAWKAVGTMLLQPLYYQRSVSNLWLSWALLGATLLLPWCLFWLTQDVRPAVMIAVVSLFFLFLLWWTIFLSTVVLQCSPIRLRSVPHLRQTMLLLSAVCWALIALAVALVLIPVGARFLVSFILVSLILTAMILLVAGRIASLFVGLLPFLWVGAWLAGSGVVRQLLVSDVAVAAGMLTTLALGAHALRQLLPARGDAHWHWAEHALQLRITLLEGRPRAIRRWFRGVNDAILARDCADRRDKGALLLHAFGPVVDWADQVNFLFFMFLIPVGFLLFDMNMMLGVVAPYFMQILLLSREQSVAMRLVATRPEQALLRLTGAMPQGGRLNALLGARLLRRALLFWLFGSAYTCLFNAVSGATLAQLIEQVSLACVALITVLGTLKNFATMRHPSKIGDNFWLMCAAFALVGVFVACRYWGVALPWPVLGALGLIVTVLVGRARWRALLQAPCALPVGRLSRP